MSVGTLLGVARLLLRRPRLWPTAVGQIFRLAPNGWWRRRPFLPLPSPEYLHFRLVTMYGGNDPRAKPADVIDYLEWCRKFPKAGWFRRIT